MDVATDTCVLINLTVVGRLDLLKLVPPYIFHAASEVLNEIEDLDQRTAVEQSIAAGHLDEVKLDQPGELGLYVGFNATLGKARARAWRSEKRAAGPLPPTNRKTRSGKRSFPAQASLSSIPREFFWRRFGQEPSPWPTPTRSK